MLPLGVNICILKNRQVLLTKREDFEVWCLPGGAVDAGETIPQAAIRETREETGLEVQLDRMVGIYSRPSWPGAGMHIVSFAGTVIGGALKPDPNEVIDMRYFDIDNLPQDIFWWHIQRIQDAASGATGAAWVQETAYPFEQQISRAEIYQRRDQSGLSRRDFYFETLGNTQKISEQLEVKPIRK